MPVPLESFLLQDEVQVFDAKLRTQLMRSNGSSVLWLDIADLSDHCPVIPLQVLKVLLCQGPSLTGMEQSTPHTRAVHTASSLEREVVGRENW